MLVLGASILIFTPQVITQPEIITAAIPPGNPDAPPSLPEPPKPPAAAESPDNGAKKVVLPISVETVEAPAVKIESSETVKSEVVKPKPEAAPPIPVPVSAPPASAPPKPAAKPVVQPQRPASSAPKAVPAYWVQIGSYTQKSGADKVKADLFERGLGSVVFDSEVQGKIYYRVRVGPYVSKAEADYWLRLVKGIKGFEKSQVWQSET
jgi:DedD protein